MPEDDFDIDVDDLQRRMDGAMASLKTEFASLRTGRASGSILEPVMVDAYGQMTPINQVGTVNVSSGIRVTLAVTVACYGFNLSIGMLNMLLA